MRRYSLQRLIFWNTVTSTRVIDCHTQGGCYLPHPPPSVLFLILVSFCFPRRIFFLEKQKIVCRQVQTPPISSPPRPVIRACGTMVGQKMWVTDHLLAACLHWSTLLRSAEPAPLPGPECSPHTAAPVGKNGGDAIPSHQNHGS